MININTNTANRGKRGPNYASLLNLELLVDYKGLGVGVDNAYGVVDGSGNVTTLKALGPGPTGRNFTSNGTAPILTSSGIVFGGAGRLRHSGANTWNFLHFNSTLTNLKTTVFAVVKFGNGSNPDAAYGLLGNNGSSSANKGDCTFFDDRASQSRNNAFRSFNAQGSGNISVNATQDNIITPNEFAVLCIETDFSVTGAYTRRLYVNNKLQGITITYAAPAMVTTPTFDLEIGGTGNGTLTAVMTLKELIIQSTVNAGDVRSVVTLDLMSKHGIGANANTATVATQTLGIYNVYQETASHYYLTGAIDQNPLKPWEVVRYSFAGIDHYGADDPSKKIVLQKSSNYGVSYGVWENLFDPAGTSIINDISGGYLNSGRHVILTDQHEALGGADFDPTSPPRLLKCIFSDDSYITKTTVDLTSILPVDPDLSTFRSYGNIIDNGGYLMSPMYRFSAELTFTQGDNLLLRCPSNADLSNPANWSITYVRSKSTAQLNESAIIGLDDATVLYMIRNEATKEYTQFMSFDNGLTFVNQGDISFGDTLLLACPPRLTKFKIENTDVIGFFYTDRDNEIYKVVYGKAATLKTSGTAGWVVSTKTSLISGTVRPAIYGKPMHPMGNFNMLLSSPYEKNPVDLSSNELILAVLPSGHYATVKTALGL